MNRDWSLLSELFFRFVNLPDEVDEAFAGLGNALLRPVRELNGRRENSVIYQFVWEILNKIVHLFRTHLNWSKQICNPNRDVNSENLKRNTFKSIIANLSLSFRCCFRLKAFYFSDLELSDCSRWSVPCVRNLELPQEVLWHVVLGQRVDHETLITCRTIARPVLCTFFLQTTTTLNENSSTNNIQI